MTEAFVLPILPGVFFLDYRKPADLISTTIAKEMKQDIKYGLFSGNVRKANKVMWFYHLYQKKDSQEHSSLNLIIHAIPTGQCLQKILGNGGR